MHFSLHGRGIVKRLKRDRGRSDADITVAKPISRDIADEFERYGVPTPRTHFQNASYAASVAAHAVGDPDDARAAFLALLVGPGGVAAPPLAAGGGLPTAATSPSFQPPRSRPSVPHPFRS